MKKIGSLQRLESLNLGQIKRSYVRYLLCLFACSHGSSQTWFVPRRGLEVVTDECRLNVRFQDAEGCSFKTLQDQGSYYDFKALTTVLGRRFEE
jgi:hypothetical protein